MYFYWFIIYISFRGTCVSRLYIQQTFNFWSHSRGVVLHLCIFGWRLDILHLMFIGQFAGTITKDYQSTNTNLCKLHVQAFWFSLCIILQLWFSYWTLIKLFVKCQHLFPWKIIVFSLLFILMNVYSNRGLWKIYNHLYSLSIDSSVILSCILLCNND